MSTIALRNFISTVLDKLPCDWINLTTHRLDIYNEEYAKIDFLEQFEMLFQSGKVTLENLQQLPTAYDYIRLGHPLSSVLEWTIAKELSIAPDQVISFASQTIGILAILRKNTLTGKKTRIVVQGAWPPAFDNALVQSVYDYDFEFSTIEALTEPFEGSTVLLTTKENVAAFAMQEDVDFLINIKEGLGSIVVIHENNAAYIPDIQHVRRRETIAMTPANCLEVLKGWMTSSTANVATMNQDAKSKVIETINQISNTTAPALVASSGLSMQYAIMMGLVHEARETHPEKEIKFIVPTNCYGGTNDQARRVAAATKNVAVVDLLVDGQNDMVSSLENVLAKIAKEDAIAYIIAEIPTNPRVEVPDLEALKATLAKERHSVKGEKAAAPVFILDQTFCPNIHFLGTENILSSVQALAYASGSKFPSGGKCTAGYCVANDKAVHLLEKIALHLALCNNEATAQQYDVLAEQLPSMNDRIKGAYINTRDFVSFIEEVLPEAKINFVSNELAQEGFTPSVFSLDLPTKGATPEEQEAYKRALNLKLINKLITEIPEEAKYCVSYGQLKGSYWTIPATSTQGTTKEGDKDYIVRAALSGNMDLERHKEVFQSFVLEHYRQ